MEHHRVSDRIWFNGQVIPMSEAHVSVEDRGFQFADGVYEVMRIYNGRCFALKAHMKRLRISADAIRLDLSYSLDELSQAIERFVADEGLADGMVYFQATRGCTARNHVYPAPGSCAPTVLFYTRALASLPAVGQGDGVKLQTVPDERWNKCWIKSIALLANVMAKNDAIAAGADEAVFVNGGKVTECSTMNLFAVIGGKLFTHPADGKILAGITRAVLIDLAPTIGIEVIERPLTVDEARHADELFVTGTTREIMWVSHWNGEPVRPGHCGPVTQRLHAALRDEVIRQTSRR